MGLFDIEYITDNPGQNFRAKRKARRGLFFPSPPPPLSLNSYISNFLSNIKALFPTTTQLFLDYTLKLEEFKSPPEVTVIKAHNVVQRRISPTTSKTEQQLIRGNLNLLNSPHAGLLHWMHSSEESVLVVPYINHRWQQYQWLSSQLWALPSLLHAVARPCKHKMGCLCMKLSQQDPLQPPPWIYLQANVGTAIMTSVLIPSTPIDSMVGFGLLRRHKYLRLK